jgi:two-component system NarL family response regulator
MVTPKPDPIARVLIAEEQSLFREAVRVVLEREEHIEVVADVCDGTLAVLEAARLRPDVAVIGLRLEGCDGITATQMIKRDAPGCGVLIVADTADDDILLSALDAGASGFLTKGSPVEELLSGIRAVEHGEMLVPPRMLAPLLDQLLRRRREEDSALQRISRLTRREREVLGLLATGAGNEGIAAKLVISPQTARTHIQNVLEKLEVHSRLEAAMFASQNGLLPDRVDSA